MRKQALLSVFLAFCVLSMVACTLPSGPTGGAGTPGQPGTLASARITPNDPTFKGCPAGGDGGDATLNTFKNRTDEGPWTIVDISTLLSLTWPSDIQRRLRSNWSDSDQATIAQYEGAAVEVTGYVLDLKHEGTESTNCHSTTYRDYHVWFAAHASDDRSQSIVIEVTPRVQAQRPGWTSSALNDLKGQHVRIRGWLLMDQEHPEQVGQTRKTLWEIHPIMHIEVDQGGGNFVSIDS
jgi:hypothetical protein